jgi:hypothetical protein
MAQDAERRRHPRNAYGGQVDAIGPSSSGAPEVAIGHDLSPQGLRIIDHPGIEAGTRVTLALHAGRQVQEVIVDAEVRRSDENGVALEFVGLTPGLRDRIARLGDGLAAIEWLSEGGAKRIVVSRVLETHPERGR